MKSREDALMNMVIGYKSAACKRLIALELTSRMQCLPYTSYKIIIPRKYLTKKHNMYRFRDGCF